MTKAHAVLLFLFAVSTAFADVDMVSQSGQWGSVCPPVLCSTPGDTWSYSFLTSSDVSSWYTGVPDPISDFQFSVNGVVVSSLSDAYGEAIWFPGSNDGGFTLLGPSGQCCFIVFGLWVPLFDYPPPGIHIATLVTGSYAAPSSSSYSFEGISDGSTDFPVGDPGLLAGPVIVTNLTTPEPAAIIFQSTVLVGIAFILRKRLLKTAQVWKRFGEGRR